MGYLLLIQDNTNLFYGTKLYGYTDTTKLKSFNYLKSLNRGIDEYTIWEDCNANEIELNFEEFKKFIDLYANELKAHGNFYTKEEFLSNEDIQKLLLNNNSKILSWG